MRRLIGRCIGLLGVAACTVSTAAADDLCGMTILTNVRLDQDLVCAGNGPIIGADGLRIDLNGHTVRGSGSGVGIDASGRTGVWIGGGTIQNFETGVLLLNSTAVVVWNNQFLANSDGVDIRAGSSGNRIGENHFQDNRARGIMARSATTKNLIVLNSFSGNRVGILLFGAVHSVVKANLVSQSGLAGIRLNVIATGNVLVANTVAANPAGIEFLVTPTGSATGNALRENTVASNTCGLKGPVTGNTLVGNLFQGNATDSCP